MLSHFLYENLPEGGKSNVATLGTIVGFGDFGYYVDRSGSCNEYIALESMFSEFLGDILVSIKNDKLFFL